MIELKTLKDLQKEFEWKYDTHKGIREEIIKWVKNLQGPDTVYPKVLNNIPETMRGELAKDSWNNAIFKYGSEYGMIAILMHIFNITEEDLK